MSLPTPSSNQSPYQNGHYKTPPVRSGVPTTNTKKSDYNHRTVFEPDAAPRGREGFLYAFDRFELGGASLTRWLLVAWLVLAGIWATGLPPLRWVGVVLFLALFIVHLWFMYRLRRDDFVEFHPQTIPFLAPEPMKPKDKLPIHVTGQLNVEGKDRRYTWLPGFFRTFATGEHAIMCRVRERRWLGIFRWPADEIGMWYAFINPRSIQQLRWGTLEFGRISAPAIAIGYELTLPPEGRRKKEKVSQETLYLAFEDDETGAQIYTNLLQKLPDEAVTPDEVPESTRAQ